MEQNTKEQMKTDLIDFGMEQYDAGMGAMKSALIEFFEEMAKDLPVIKTKDVVKLLNEVKL